MYLYIYVSIYISIYLYLYLQYKSNTMTPSNNIVGVKLLPNQPLFPQHLQQEIGHVKGQAAAIHAIATAHMGKAPEGRSGTSCAMG